MQPKNEIIGRLFRQQAGKMASILIGMFGFQHAELIEDAIQDTFVAALKVWGMKGLPEHPEAWLMKVAKHKTINELRKKGRHKELNKEWKITKEEDVQLNSESFTDKTLVHIKALFGCCNPLLSPKSQIMITLKYVCGFGDKEIARALFMEQAAVRKAIYRAKNVLREHQNFLLELSTQELKQRLPIVEKVLYLMFNEGYSTSKSDSVFDADLSFEALRLIDWILETENLSDASTHALYALMLFQFSRYEARCDKNGIPLSIEEQNREMWNKQVIKKGLFHQKKSRETEKLSRYHIESGIASIHSTASSYNDTNWDQIITLYRQLLTFDDSVSVRTNLAIALCEQGEIEESLNLLHLLVKSEQKNNSVIYASIGRVYSKSGEIEKAISSYNLAKKHCSTRYERAFIDKKLLELTY